MSRFRRSRSPKTPSMKRCYVCHRRTKHRFDHGKCEWVCVECE